MSKSDNPTQRRLHSLLWTIASSVQLFSTALCPLFFSPRRFVISNMHIRAWRDDQIDAITMPTVPRRQSIQVGEVWAPCHRPPWISRVMGASNHSRLDKGCWWVALYRVSLPRSHYFSKHRESALFFFKCNLSGCLRKPMSLKSTIKLDVLGHSQCPSLSRYRYPNIVCRSLPDQIWSRTRRVCFGSCDIDILTLPWPGWHSEERNIIDMRKWPESYEVLTNPVSGRLALTL